MTLDAYTTLAAFQDFVRDADGTDSDIEELALEAAARAIERTCGRDFAAATGTPSARYYTARWDKVRQRYVLDVDDFMTTTGLVVASDDGTRTYPTTLTGYLKVPLNADAKGKPWTRLVFDSGVTPSTDEGGMSITADWGWTAIPNTIVQANLIQAARFLKRRDAAFGIAGSPDMGNELRLLSKLDPDVAVMVGAYKRNWGAV